MPICPRQNGEGKVAAEWKRGRFSLNTASIQQQQRDSPLHSEGGRERVYNIPVEWRKGGYCVSEGRVAEKSIYFP